MENIKIKGRRSLPEVDFDAVTGILSLKGVSLQGSDPEYLDIYNPIMEWLDNYALSPAEKTVMNVELKVFCTGTSKRLLRIFQMLEKIYISGHGVIVNWFYEGDDPDMEEAGIEYSDIVDVPFNQIKKE